MNTAKAIGIALVFAAGFFIAWKLQQVRYLERETQLIETKLAAAKEQAEHYERQRMETEMQRAKLISELGAKNAEIDDLQRDVAAVSKRLRIRAVCPAGTTADAAGTGTGTAELAADARSAYFDLRRGIVKTESMLEFCRAELRNRSK